MLQRWHPQQLQQLHERQASHAAASTTGTSTAGSGSRSSSALLHSSCVRSSRHALPWKQQVRCISQSHHTGVAETGLPAECLAGRPSRVSAVVVAAASAGAPDAGDSTSPSGSSGGNSGLVVSKRRQAAADATERRAAEAAAVVAAAHKTGARGSVRELRGRLIKPSSSNSSSSSGVAGKPRGRPANPPVDDEKPKRVRIKPSTGKPRGRPRKDDNPQAVDNSSSSNSRSSGSGGGGVGDSKGASSSSSSGGSAQRRSAGAVADGLAAAAACAPMPGESLSESSSRSSSGSSPQGAQRGRQRQRRQSVVPEEVLAPTSSATAVAAVAAQTPASADSSIPDDALSWPQELTSSSAHSTSRIQPATGNSRSRRRSRASRVTTMPAAAAAAADTEQRMHQHQQQQQHQQQPAADLQPVTQARGVSSSTSSSGSSGGGIGSTIQWHQRPNSPWYAGNTDVQRELLEKNWNMAPAPDNPLSALPTAFDSDSDGDSSSSSSSGNGEASSSYTDSSSNAGVDMSANHGWERWRHPELDALWGGMDGAPHREGLPFADEAWRQQHQQWVQQVQQQQQQHQQQEQEEEEAGLERSSRQLKPAVSSASVVQHSDAVSKRGITSIPSSSGRVGGGAAAELPLEPSPMEPPSGLHPELQALYDEDARHQAQMQDTWEELYKLDKRLDKLLAQPNIQGVITATALLITQSPETAHWLSRPAAVRQKFFDEVCKLRQRKEEVQTRLDSLQERLQDFEQKREHLRQLAASSSLSQGPTVPPSTQADSLVKSISAKSAAASAGGSSSGRRRGGLASIIAKRSEPMPRRAQYAERRQRRMERSAASQRLQEQQLADQQAQPAGVSPSATVDDVASEQLTQLQEQLLALEQLGQWSEE